MQAFVYYLAVKAGGARVRPHPAWSNCETATKHVAWNNSEAVV